MALLTLVPDALAAPGYRFTFVGPNKGGECDGCPFQKLCFGLAPGHTYEVLAVRPVTHPCALHEGGRVRAVEVAEIAFATSLERQHLRGTAAHWAPPPCGRPDCVNWALCNPTGHHEGARHAIVAQHGPLQCPAGYDLEKVDLKPMD